MDHFPYLLAAYTIIFVVLFVYVRFIRGRQKHVERELRALEQEIREVEHKAEPPARRQLS